MKKNINMTDGMEVASFFMSWYLNTFRSITATFINLMDTKPEEIKDNFTFLAFSWIHKLAGVRDFDDRNADSVFLARDVCLHVPDMPKMHRLQHDDETNMDVDTADDAQVVHMMAVYLAADSGDAYKDFLLYALNEHRTLQQSMTRLFRDWLTHVAESQEAEMVSGYLVGHALPLI